MHHLGILAHSTEGAALCFRAYCQEGFRELGPHQHPDVTLDCIAMARSMPAWDAGDHASIRALLVESAERLARADADFFVCPDNTAHIALEHPGEDLPLPGTASGWEIMLTFGLSLFLFGAALLHMGRSAIGLRGRAVAASDGSVRAAFKRMRG